ncbi:hypothetical protein GCM10010306_098810 [Streptomyces umbrinus]|nr:hypothetical protein GCM10010306_098810 [Streptomyces umbrinus]
MTAPAETRTVAGLVGADVPRRDAEDKIRGWTRFAVDCTRARMLHAAVRRANRPAARIVWIDTSAAAAMPGVRAVVTAADAPGRYGVGVADHPLFADGVVRYHGGPLVAVAAETLAQARAAAAAVEVELAPLPAHLTMADALAPGAREIHPDWASYEELVVVVESSFSAGRQNQTPLEPRACTAWTQDGRFVLETSTQNPWRSTTAQRNCSASVLSTSASSYHPSAADSA